MCVCVFCCFSTEPNAPHTSTYLLSLQYNSLNLLITITSFILFSSLLQTNNDCHLLQRLDWSSSEDDTRMCKYKGKSEEVCQNYIKVLAKLGDERLLVCGTNAFKPKCRTYQYGPVS